MGIRTGNPRGRPPGARNRRTEAVVAASEEMARAIEDALPEAFTGDAHALLMAVYKDMTKDLQVRVDAAKAAIRYEKPALSSVEAQVDANVKASVRSIERRIIDPSNRHAEGIPPAP